MTPSFRLQLLSTIVPGALFHRIKVAAALVEPAAGSEVPDRSCRHVYLWEPCVLCRRFPPTWRRLWESNRFFKIGCSYHWSLYTKKYYLFFLGGCLLDERRENWRTPSLMMRLSKYQFLCVWFCLCSCGVGTLDCLDLHCARPPLIQSRLKSLTVLGRLGR